MQLEGPAVHYFGGIDEYDHNTRRQLDRPGTIDCNRPGGIGWPPRDCGPRPRIDAGHAADRKSTRLNSSHRCISYAVFCLKKKTQQVRENINLTFSIGLKLNPDGTIIDVLP